MKKKERKRILVSLVISLLMVISAVAFSFNLKNSEEENKILKFKYNGKAIEVEMKYRENETESVKRNYFPYFEEFINNKFYFYSDPKLKEKAIRLLSFINYFAVLNEACLQDKPCYSEVLPIKDCNNNFIVFEYSEEEEIRKDGNCIFLKGNETSIDKVIDAFFYEIKK